MNVHEIVIEEMQCNRRFEIVYFLRKCVRKSSKSTHLHTYCQVLPFNDVARQPISSLGKKRPHTVTTLSGHSSPTGGWTKGECADRKTIRAVNYS